MDIFDQLDSELLGETDAAKFGERPPRVAHQDRAMEQIARERDLQRGKRVKDPILVVGPCGSGKSRIMTDLTMEEVSRGGQVVLKVHRNMLLEQLIDDLTGAGIDFGIIQADYAGDPHAPVQLASTQTLYRRAIKSQTIDMPDATLVINDEAHQQAGAMERSLIYGAMQGGCVIPGWSTRQVDVVGFTATPVSQSKIYRRMVEFATYSLMREVKFHQKVKVYGPSEIDMSGLRPNAEGNFATAKLGERAVKLHGSIYSSWKSLNPFALPTIGFAPCVPSSKWFAFKFADKGVPVAHMDGELILYPEVGPRGAVKLKEIASTRENRAMVLAGSKDGSIKIVWNRFLLREAIDMPWLYHGIFATVMGSITSALQSVGRLQRFWGDYDFKIMQDHGGWYWRHGSPNDDRRWKLGYAAKHYQRERVKRLAKGEEFEGLCCPKCSMWRKSGPVCPGCGNNHKRSMRVVQTKAGTLKEMHGSVYKKEKAKPSDMQRLWTAHIFRGYALDHSVDQAVALFCSELQRKGLPVDWKLFLKLNHAPPNPDSADYRRKIRSYYPWARRRTERK